jgi:hypothetical protein
LRAARQWQRPSKLFAGRSRGRIGQKNTNFDRKARGDVGGKLTRVHSKGPHRTARRSGLGSRASRVRHPFSRETCGERPGPGSPSNQRDSTMGNHSSPSKRRSHCGPIRMRHPRSAWRAGVLIRLLGAGRSGAIKTVITDSCAQNCPVNILSTRVPEFLIFSRPLVRTGLHFSVSVRRN